MSSLLLIFSSIYKKMSYSSTKTSIYIIIGYIVILAFHKLNLGGQTNVIFLLGGGGSRGAPARSEPATGISLQAVLWIRVQCCGSG